MTDEPDNTKTDKPNKKPEPRRPGGKTKRVALKTVTKKAMKKAPLKAKGE
jgi:hypothetical protein